jgi:hypothetical protein
MSPNPFDQACRYLLRLWAAPLLAWLLRLAPEQLDFVDWLDTRQVAWPGHPDQTCDTVAHLRDPLRGGLPWAAVVEFQVQPDELMFGRGLRYLGDLWQTCKPTGHKGDRFEVGLVVVNLTGRGSASRRMHLSKTRVRTVLDVEEWNLSTLSAKKVLRQIDEGKAPPALLAWVPLFRGGDRPGILPEWKRLAAKVESAERRRSLGLAVVFAEATGCASVWPEGLKEWEMIESKIVKQWTEQASQAAFKEGKRGMLLRLMQRRFKTVPKEVEQAIRACGDAEKLDAAGDALITASSLEEFRREAGL